MSYGSNEVVLAQEAGFREKITLEIANIAAELVAAGDMSREKAIEDATKYMRYQQEADRDVTGVIETLEEAQRPIPSRPVSSDQVRAIAIELMDAARDAAESLYPKYTA